MTGENTDRFCDFFFKSGSIEDVKEDRRGRLKITIQASSEKRDPQGDKFLRQAWENPEDVEYWRQKGLYDWNHLYSMLTKEKKRLSDLAASGETVSATEIEANEVARQRAVIGNPERNEKALFWSEQTLDGEPGGRLLSQGIIFGENQYVRDIIAPALKAGSDRVAASVQGGSWAPSEATKRIHGAKTWDRSRLQTISLCYLNEAWNDETLVAMRKSMIAELSTPDQTDTEPSIRPMIVNIPEGILKGTAAFGKALGMESRKLIDDGLLIPEYGPLYQFFKANGLSHTEADSFAKAVITRRIG